MPAASIATPASFTNVRRSIPLLAFSSIPFPPGVGLITVDTRSNGVRTHHSIGPLNPYPDIASRPDECGEGSKGNPSRWVLQDYAGRPQLCGYLAPKQSVSVHGTRSEW